MMELDAAMRQCPLVAILRGIEPGEAADVGLALVDAGFSIIEVPLNSPEPFASIERLATACGSRALIGAGTVMTPDDVIQVRDAGGQLIVMPHGDGEVIEEAKAEGLICIPGCATPTEGFAALTLGADALKLFPAEAMPPAVVKAWRAVFPPTARFIMVGGVGPETIADYLAAGAAGFGIGSQLYAPGRSPAEVARRGAALVAAWRQAAFDGSR